MLWWSHPGKRQPWSRILKARANVGRHRSTTATHIEGFSELVFYHFDDLGVTTDAFRRLCSELGAVF